MVTGILIITNPPNASTAYNMGEERRGGKGGGEEGGKRKGGGIERPPLLTTFTLRSWLDSFSIFLPESE